MNKAELKDFLDSKVEQYNNPKFIETDPIQIPHVFSKKEDIEIAGFLTATIAWGNRKSIINNARQLVNLMEDAPFDFVINHSETDLKKLLPFVHRTFNGDDFIQFTKSLKHIYLNHNGLESVFVKYAEHNSLQNSISKKILLNFEMEFCSELCSAYFTKTDSNPLCFK